GKDDAFRMQGSQRLFGFLERHDLAIDLLLAHPARDQLGYLRAEIDDEDFVMLREPIGAEPIGAAREGRIDDAHPRSMCCAHALRSRWRSKWTVDAVKFHFGRDHALVRHIEPGLQAFHPSRDSVKVASELGHHLFYFIIDLIFLDGGQLPVTYDHLTIDHDMTHAATRFDMHELAHRAVERRPARIAHVDQCQV